MRDTGETYMDFMAHPDEPAYTEGGQQGHQKLDFQSSRGLTRQIWKQIY